MRNISSFYLHNTGFEDIWFSNLYVPCMSPAANEPVHTILGAGNGAGKSTSISLLFSLLVPAKNKFLRTQRDSLYEFRDYFDTYYCRPGFVVIEFDAGPAERDLFLANEGAREKIIIGQAVCLSQSNKDYLYRRFFSFRATNETGMRTLLEGTEGVKALKSITTQTEFKDWLKSMRALTPNDHPSNFYDTENQQDWLEHLAGKGIDTLLSSIQWHYNKQEGGREVKNTNTFLDTRDFLRKFMGMCLNESTAAALKENITSNIRNLSDVPRFEKELGAFRTIEKRFEPFRQAAQDLQQANASLTTELQDARGLLSALKHKTDTLKAQKQSLQEIIEAQSQKVSASQEKIHEAENKERGMKKALLEARIRDFGKAYDEAITARQVAQDRLGRLNARKKLVDIDNYAARIRANEQQLELVGADLKIFKDRAQKAGAEYRSALMASQSFLEAQKRKSDRTTQCLQKAEGSLTLRIETLDGQKNDATKQLAIIRERQDMAAQQSKRLVDRGDLRPGESSLKAQHRIRDELAVNLEIKETTSQSIAEMNNRLKTLQTEITDNKKTQAVLAGQIEEKEREYAKGRELAKGLLIRLHQGGIVDTMGADLENPLAMRKLEEQHDLLQEQSATLAIQKGGFENDRTCVERFKVTGVDHNASTVTRALNDAGISAMPYGSYLASILADNPEKAREIYLSNPARFSGVQVLDQDSVKAAASLSGLELDRPVVVSVATDTPETVPTGCVIVHHNGHALYNNIAAKDYGDQLEKRLEKVERSQSDTHAKIKDTISWITELSSYLAEYGSGQLNAIKSQKEKLIQKAVDLNKWLKEADSSFVKLEKRLSEEQDKLQAITAEEQDITTRLDRVTEHIENYESKLSQWERQIHEIDTSLAAIQLRLAKQKAFLGRSRDLFLQHKERASDLKNEIKLIDDLLAKIEHDSGKSYDVGMDFRSLQKAYEESSEALKAEENGKHKEVSNILKTLREEHRKKLQRYKEQFGKYSEPDVRTVSVAGIDANIQAAEAAFARAKNEASEAKTDLDQAQGAYQSELKRWKASDLKITDVDLDEFISQETISDLLSEIAAQIKTTAQKRDNANQEIEKQTARLKKTSEDLLVFVEAGSHVEGAADQLADITAVPTPNVRVPAVTDAVATAKSQQKRLNQNIGKVRQMDEQAQKYHRDLMQLLESEEIRTLVPHESALMLQAGRGKYDAFAADADNKAHIITDRMKMLLENISRSEESLQECAMALAGGVENGLRLLKHAVRFKVPESVPSFGGQQVLRIINLDKLAKSQVPLKDHLKRFIKRLISNDGMMPSGHRLVADALIHAADQMALKLRVLILKPVPAIGSFKHVDIESYNSSSGGEGLTSALMYYLLSAHIRGKEQGKAINFGGALILDNPVGEANLAKLLRAQREIATRLGIQLIYFTGIQDPESMNEFDYHVTLRTSKMKDQATGRHYMEIWPAELQPGLAS